MRNFYPSLISEKALLSEIGLSVLATADAFDFNLFMNEAEYQEYIRSWFRVVNDGVVCYSEGLKNGLKCKTIVHKHRLKRERSPLRSLFSPRF